MTCSTYLGNSQKNDDIWHFDEKNCMPHLIYQKIALHDSTLKCEPTIRKTRCCRKDGRRTKKESLYAYGRTTVLATGCISWSCGQVLVRMPHTVLTITIKSPENKEFESLVFLLKRYLHFIFTLQVPQKCTLPTLKPNIKVRRAYQS